MRLPANRSARWRGRVRALRRRVLAHRRALAALAVAVAVLAGLRAVAPAPPETEPVPVATRDLEAGTLLRETDLTTRDYPPGSTPERLAVDAVGRTLAAPLRRGEPVTDVRLVQAALTEGYPAGTAAVPVRLPDAGSVALLRVGDRIDLLATDPASGRTSTVASHVPVLALPDPALDHDVAAGSGLTGRLVVLGVDGAALPEVTGAAVSRYLTYAFTH